MPILERDGYFMVPTKGAVIMDAINAACEISRTSHENVTFLFNGVLVYVTPTSDPQDVAEGWEMRRDELQAAGGPTPGKRAG